VKKRGNNIRYKVKVYKSGIFIGEFFGASEAARAIGVTKQAVWEAIASGINRCRGFDLKVERGKKCRHEMTIDQAKQIAREEKEAFLTAIPDALYA